jgi:hypothetical protein
MTLNQNFIFPPAPDITKPEPPFPGIDGDLGPLHDFLFDPDKSAQWVGEGFNCIWRPNSTPQSDHFLELNRTNDGILFERIPGEIPNRGLLQPDIVMFGVSYLQKISDANIADPAKSGLHFEPGIWAVVPKTTNPTEIPTVLRMASIPHGTAILAQGSAFQHPGGPVIADNDLFPFPIGQPSNKLISTFQDNLNLSKPDAFRTPDPLLKGITQDTVNSPNSLLRAALAGKTVKQTTTLIIATDSTPVPGGGVANTAFLQGAPGSGPNADAAVVSATFWIELIEGAPDFFQLQYTQIVLLNFAGLSWPHVTVGTLRKEPVV